MTIPDLPTTTHAIRHYAADRPGADAVIDGGTRYDYAKFAHALAQTTAELHAMGIAPGVVVGIQAENVFVHWLLLLACETLGAVSMSLSPAELQRQPPLHRRCQVVFADLPAQPDPAQRWTRITLDWIAGALNRPVGPADLARLDTIHPPDTITRIIASSGTTGEPKLIAKSAALMHRTALVKLRDCPLGQFDAPRFMTLYNLSVPGAHFSATAAILAGGTAIFTRGTGIFRDITRFRPHVAWMIVGQIADTLRNMPADFRKPEQLAIATTGGTISPGLRHEALQRLATEICETYTASETSTMALIDADGDGRVFDGIEAAIIDDAGAALLYGEAGTIKVRGATVIAGYLDDPELDARTFRDGWYISSDVGIMAAPGRLRVLGRRDDMLNVGGLKIAPAPIETKLAAIAGVRVAAVAAVPNAMGLGELCAALELEDGILLTDVSAAVLAVLRNYGRARDCRAVPAIPLTHRAKIDRRAVGELFARPA